MNENKEVILGEVEITTRNGYKEFTASFDSVTPFENEESNGVEYYENLLDECYSAEDKYNMCERYDCKPSELVEVLAEEEGIETLADEKDCSVYSNRIYVNGVEYAFESMSGGQYDFLEDCDMLQYTNEKAVKKIYDFWKEKHLKEITDKEEEEILKVLSELELTPQEEEETIAQYIENYL